MARGLQAEFQALQFSLGPGGLCGTWEASDPLFRDIGKLSGDDREIAHDFLKMLTPGREEGREPMTRVFSLKTARQTAEAFLKEEGITTLPVDPFAIADSRVIAVEGKPGRPTACPACCCAMAMSCGIVSRPTSPAKVSSVSASATSWGITSVRPRRPAAQARHVHVSRTGFITADLYELEADHYAAGLSMPEAPFRRAIDQYDPGLDAIGRGRSLPHVAHDHRHTLCGADRRGGGRHHEHGRQD